MVQIMPRIDWSRRPMNSVQIMFLTDNQSNRETSVNHCKKLTNEKNVTYENIILYTNQSLFRGLWLHWIDVHESYAWKFSVVNGVQWNPYKLYECTWSWMVPNFTEELNRKFYVVFNSIRLLCKCFVFVYLYRCTLAIFENFRQMFYSFLDWNYIYIWKNWNIITWNEHQLLQLQNKCFANFYFYIFEPRLPYTLLLISTIGCYLYSILLWQTNN